MLGTFAQWQPVYAEAGIATFPVDGEAKRPAVGNYLKGGIPASREWARKFADATALGIACGKRNRLTVLDIDAADAGLLERALVLFGQTPIIVRTPSGKFHAWYRHNGERRMIRSAMPGEPVDVLGNGFAIAPPSKRGMGIYEFISGSLADLGALPTMSALVLDDEARGGPTSYEARAPAGQRNNMLFQACMVQAPVCSSVGQLVVFASAMNNSDFAEPLGAAELLKTVNSAWALEEAGKNWFGRGRRVVATHDEVDDLMQSDPDAFLLLTKLRRYHWNNKHFVIANQMHQVMPGGGWARKRFTSARAILEQRGLIILVRTYSKVHGPALYRFP